MEFKKGKPEDGLDEWAKDAEIIGENVYERMASNHRLRGDAVHFNETFEHAGERPNRSEASKDRGLEAAEEVILGDFVVEPAVKNQNNDEFYQEDL
ncbi:hypothetical protein DNHGIG_12880 [Collibacillus ludicampi]|uniref:Uncharacterized protein n=1 Tax=Collibacillus ludicampi TaxID=2771369 RepID=A0AAV4LDJ2_9BACL|nr:hypothetical protein [Collibacillus ludicampi]GIM45739.1 hypothetical protein DNHGIG_12880 [Collibacillus ludicampi]